jgi:hypothetical protein
VHALSSADIADFISVPAAPCVYRIDRQHDQNPRSATIAGISGDTIALTTADADLFFTSYMEGTCFVRIWNVSKTPNAPAWVKHSGDTSHLQATNAADLAGWAAGNVIQIGDPTSVTASRAIALDISPMLQTTFGVVFRQKALLTKVSLTGVNAKAQLDLSPSGVAGTFANSYTASDGSQNGIQLLVPSSVASPISNSNLVFVRETIATPGAISVDLVSIMGVYV